MIKKSLSASVFEVFGSKSETDSLIKQTNPVKYKK